MSLETLGTIELTKDKTIQHITERQKGNTLKIKWDTLPDKSKILIHYGNGTYVGVERDGNKINIVYSSRVTISDTGESFFGTKTKTLERNTVIYESEIEIGD